MEESILTSIKKMLGLDADYTAFDTDIIVHINSVLMILEQQGIGTTNYQISGNDQTWTAYLSGTTINVEALKSYVYLRVRLLFDPPTTSFTLDAYQKQIQEYEWRLYMQAKEV